MNFKHALTRKSVYITALSVCLIAVVAFAVLSFLITRDSRKNTEDFARRTFFRKYESIENEFRNIEDYQYLLRALIRKDGLKNYKDYSSVLNDLNKKGICWLTAGIIMTVTVPENLKPTAPCLIFLKIMRTGKKRLPLRTAGQAISGTF